jgi:hypothetical protein
MIGTFETPTLDLDPSVPSSLDVITAARAGVASFTDASGLIQEATANTVRVDHSLGYPAMLIEPSATNYVNNSSSFNYNIVTETTGIDAPDGTNTAKRIEGILSANGEVAFSRALTIPASSEITGSIYVRGVAGEVLVVYLKRYSGGDFIASVSQTVTLTGGWQRIEGLTMTLNANNTNAAITITKSGSSTADSVDLWGGQIEAGSVSTSVIPTSGSAVTRAADDLSITGSAFSDFYNQSEGTIYVEFVPKLEALDATLFNFSDGSNFNRIMSLTKFYHIFVTTSGNTQVQFASGSVSLNNLNRLAASFKTNDCVLSLNGSSEVVDSSMAMPSINQINIGTRFGGTDHLQGHIRRLIYWPTSSDRL